MTSEAGAPAPRWRTVLAVCSLILIVTTGARSSWGLFLPEMTQARGWSRETFSFAIAVQHLVWGASAVLLGAMADRFGAMRTIVLGVALYVAGFAGMLASTSGAALALSAGVLIGLGVGGTGFGIVFAAVAKLVPAERRTWAFGIGTAASSFGQFLFLPATGEAIRAFGWQDALVANAVAVAAVAALALGVRGDREAAARSGGGRPVDALRASVRDRSFRLLGLGYFVCGVQVVFVWVHLPAYLADQGLPLGLGAQAIALIGLFNVVGSLAAGWLGGRCSKKGLLSAIYLARSAVVAAFVAVPPSTVTVWLFSAAMGLLWLSTVPLTNGLVGQIYGVRHLGLLGGIVFLAHQVGSFLGSWLGGRVFDATGSYGWAWVGVIATGVFAAIVHLPIDRRPIAVRAPAAV